MSAGVGTLESGWDTSFFTDVSTVWAAAAIENASAAVAINNVRAFKHEGLLCCSALDYKIDLKRFQHVVEVIGCAKLGVSSDK